MTHSGLTRHREVAPRAAALIEGMRDIGYSLETAVADVIDNSITANARKIELLTDTHSDNPAIGILDDGVGMSEDVLLEAMRPGSRSPLESRAQHDLGRFGLGLKTASFSQCRRLTVLTRRQGKASCAIWDLDFVAETDEWLMEVSSDAESVPWSDKLGESGTLIVWQKLDRLTGSDTKDNRRNLVRQIDEMATHVELVFHRFLSGEGDGGRVSILLNGRRLEPFDPFHSRHPATIFGPEEVFSVGSQEIRIQPMTLPHHQKVSAEQWSRYAGSEGYLRNQGFYVYREKRLIIYGTWFNLARQTELTKLARVRVDMPNSMDSDWKIDLKKASAQPPAQVRDRLRRIVEEIGATSRRVYRGRGERLTSDDRLPVWVRKQSKNQISYSLNFDHPAFTGFSAQLDEERRKEFESLLQFVTATLPIDSLFSDVAASPENVSARAMSEEALSEAVIRTCQILRAGGYTNEEVEAMMSAAEPFRSNRKVALQILGEMNRKS